MIKKLAKLFGIKGKKKFDVKFKGKIPKNLDSKEFRKELETVSKSIMPFFQSVDAAMTNDNLKKTQKEVIAMTMGNMIMDSYTKILSNHINVEKTMDKYVKSAQKETNKKNNLENKENLGDMSYFG